MALDRFPARTQQISRDELLTDIATLEAALPKRLPRTELDFVTDAASRFVRVDCIISEEVIPARTSWRRSFRGTSP